MSARKLRLLAECLEREFMTVEDRKGWITDLRGAAKDLERSMAEAMKRTRGKPIKDRCERAAGAIYRSWNLTNLKDPTSIFYALCAANLSGYRMAQRDAKKAATEESSR